MKAQPDTINVTLYIHAKKQFDGNIQYAAYGFPFSPEYDLGFVVAEHTIELPVPAITKAELNQAEIESLRTAQNNILADAEIKTRAIEDQIQALLCLEGTVISKDDEQIPY